MDIKHADDPVLLGIHVLIIITGLVDCFFGYRAFKYGLGILLGIAGAALAGYFAWQYFDGSWTLSLVGFVIGGITGAVLAVFFFQTAVVVVGAFLGYILISPWIVDFAPWMQLLILVFGCGIIGMLSIFVAKTAIMLATATTGAFRIIYPGWYLIGGPAVLVLGKDPEAGIHLLAASQDVFIAVVVLAAVGFFVQFFHERKRKARDES